MLFAWISAQCCGSAEIELGDGVFVFVLSLTAVANVFNMNAG